MNNGLHRWYAGGSYDIDYNEEMIRFFTNTLDVTGLEEQTSESLTVYPNPATNFIQIESAEAIGIYDLSGRLLMEGSGNMDVSSLPNGMYFIKAGSESKKLIINR